MSGPRPLLAIEASTDYGSVAVGGVAGVLAEVGTGGRAGHSSKLLPAVDAALRAVGLGPADLGGVVVGAGPGSFTGIRIAAATAKGIARAREIPLYAYSSLLATAANAWAHDGPVCALADARGTDVYAACYRFGGTIEVKAAPAAVSIDEIVDRYLDGAVPLFVGDGALRHMEILTGRLGARVADVHHTAPRAASLLWLVARAPAIGLVADPSAWEPEYLRASGAERIAAARKEVTGSR